MFIVLRVLLIISLFIFIKLLISKCIAKKVLKENDFRKIQSENINNTFFTAKLKIYIGILIIFFIYFIFLDGFIKTAWYSILVTLFIIMYKKIRGEATKKQVLLDLLNISECLSVELSSQISLEIALKKLPYLCKNKEFSRLLTNLYLEYELYKFTINNSSIELQRKFNYSEIKMFISAISQTQHTSMLELIDNLISILHEEYIVFLEDVTKNKMAIMTLGVFVIVINVALIGIYPVLVESFTAINTIFG